MKDWIAMISEAKDVGLTIEEIKIFIEENKKKPK